MPKSKTSDIVLGCIAALVLIAGLSGTYYFYNKNNELSAVVNTKQMELKALQQKILGYPKVLAELNNLAAEENRLMNFIPTAEQQKEFVWELEELASQSGIKINQCDIAGDVKSLANLPQYNVYQWKLKIKGNFDNLNSFLNALLVSKRAAMVSELKISAGESAEKEGKTDLYVLNVDMTLDLIAKSSQEKVAQ